MWTRCPVAEESEEDLATKMVGREVTLHIEKKPATPGDVVFSIEDLTVRDNRGIEKARGLSLNVHKGEILGIAGIDGHRPEGARRGDHLPDPLRRGQDREHGAEIQNTTTRNVLDHGICTIHEDRHKRGLVLSFRWRTTW